MAIAQTPAEAAPPAITAPASALVRLTDALFRNRVHLIAIAALSMWAWPRFLGFAVLPIDFLVVPLTVLCVYQWNRLTDRREDAINCPTDLEQALQHRREIVVTCSAALLIVIASMLTSGNVLSSALLLALLALGFAYSTPARWRLKSIFLVKNASSALGWSLLTLVYPAAHAHATLGKPLAFAVAAMLAGVFSSELIWDVRDVRGDAAAGIGSLPVRFGYRPVIATMVLLNVLYVAAVVVAVASHEIPPRWLYTSASSVLCLAAAPWLRRFAVRRWTHVLVLGQALLLSGLALFPAR